MFFLFKKVHWYYNLLTATELSMKNMIIKLLFFLLPISTVYSSIDINKRLHDNYLYVLEVAQTCPNALRIFSATGAIFNLCTAVYDFDVSECYDETDSMRPKGAFQIAEIMVCGRNQIITILKTLITNGGQVSEEILKFYDIKAKSQVSSETIKKNNISRTKQLEKRMKNNLRFVLENYPICRPSAFRMTFNGHIKKNVEVLYYYRVGGCFSSLPPKDDSSNPDKMLLETMCFSDSVHKQLLLKPFLKTHAQSEIEKLEKEKGFLLFP